jgi:lactocepin
MSTADPIVAGNDVEASPRQQGAGLVNAAEAVNTKAYLTVNGGRPKAELGDSDAGVYTFTFEIKNMSAEAQTYALSSSLLTEAVVDYGFGEYFMAGQDMELTGKVTFDKETVTVPANGTASVTVTIALSNEDKAMFEQYWENGGYVEGFVYLENADEYGVDLNLPFMGFYGDWTQAPIFDSGYWYENS